KDKATGKEQQIRIQASGGLSEADIERMVKDAEAHAAEDKRKRELVDARNQAESLIHTTDKTLKEGGDKIAAGDRSTVEAAIKELRDVVSGEDADAIKAKTEALGQAAMKLGEAMYKAQQAGGGEAGPGAGPGAHPGAAPGGDAGGAKPDDKVVDADFEE